MVYYSPTEKKNTFLVPNNKKHFRSAEKKTTRLLNPFYNVSLKPCFIFSNDFFMNFIHRVPTPCVLAKRPCFKVKHLTKSSALFFPFSSTHPSDLVTFEQVSSKRCFIFLIYFSSGCGIGSKSCAIKLDILLRHYSVELGCF